MNKKHHNETKAMAKREDRILKLIEIRDLPVHLRAIEYATLDEEDDS